MAQSQEYAISDERQWDKCFFCQSSDVSQLRDPFKSPSSKNSPSVIYKTLSQRILDLIQLNAIPQSTLDVTNISGRDFLTFDADELATVLSTKHAVWPSHMLHQCQF